MKSGIYCIKNIVNNKIYIGSSKNIQNRKQQHFSMLNRNKHYNKHLQASYIKHDTNAFIFGIIEYCEDDTLINKEEYWVNYYETYNPKKGYNKIGPISSSGNKWSFESKQRFSNYKKNDEKSLKHLEQVREKLKKPVKCFTEEGILIKKYESVTSAAKDIKGKLELIIRACKDPSKRCRGFIWRYEEDDFVYKRHNNGLEKPVLKIDKNFNIIDEFACGRLAAESMGSKYPAVISQVANGTRKSYKGFYWIYKEDYYKKLSDYLEINNLNPVNCGEDLISLKYQTDNEKLSVANGNS